MKPISWRRAKQLLLQGLTLEDGRIIRLLDPAKFCVDHTYQRTEPASQVRRISGDNFDPSALSVFQVGQRQYKGTLNVVDGQTRRAAILYRRNIKLKTPKLVLTLVTPDTTQAQEAKMFTLHNTNKPVAGANKFRARLVWNQDPELSINRAVEAEGFSIDFYAPGRPSDENTVIGGIRSSGMLIKAYQMCHKHFAPALRLLRVLGGNGKADLVPTNLRTGYVVWGLAMFLQGQSDKTTVSIVNRFKIQATDIGAIWEDVMQGHTSMSHPRRFAERLNMACGLAATLKLAKAS